jgi:hypothetical protein
MNWKVKALEEKGELITQEGGNSMLPIIKSHQKHKLKACKWEDCVVDDIVFCHVAGRFITHKVHAKNALRGLQIGNNRGYINGWTRKVFGKVVEIYKD